MNLRTKNVNFSIQNCEKLNFKDESFDFVNCHGVLHHTPNTQEGMNEIYRILKYNGRDINFTNYSKKGIL